MDSSQTYDLTCEALGYSDSHGLIQASSPEQDTNRRRFFAEAADRLTVDAAYFVRTPQGADLPVVYFRRLSAFSPDEVRLLHQRIWNQGIVPLLFVICPGEIRVYNCCAEPVGTQEPFDNETRLLEHLQAVENVEQIRRGLQDFGSLHLESGDFWRQHGDYFQQNGRVDKHLLNNLQIVRRKLRSIPSAATGKPPEYSDIHSLLGRSIFVQYLQDRKVLQRACSEDQCLGCTPYTDILLDKARTYQLFELLAGHFKGDMFPLEETEYQSIDQAHLQVLRDFLTGTNLKTGQYSFWPYMFDIIPIELISAIYEEFFHQEKGSPNATSGGSSDEDKVGTYYTPPFLADFLLEEVLPWQGNDLQTRVLDPACGSGVFLVGAYRRLIGRWQRHFQQETITSEKLVGILRNSIFGVDINPGAIRVTVFSLYLALLDSVDADSIWCQVEFPSLIGTNLFDCDFFNNQAPFNEMKFDVVIGNPPWTSIPADQESSALAHCNNKDYPIGDRQLAQAFLWRAPEFVSADGVVCLLATAKGLLFNESTRNQRFRHEFFSRFDVMTIINLALWRSFLFPTAAAACAVVIYRPRLEEAQSSSLMYVVPKVSSEPKALNAVVIDSPDIKYIPRNLTITDSRIWKVAMWGGVRDMELAARFADYPHLKEVCESKGRKPSEGFNQGNQSEKSKKKVRDRDWARGNYRIPNHPDFHHPRMASLPYMTPEALKAGSDVCDLDPLCEEYFERSRPLELYTGPAVLVNQSPFQGRIYARYVEPDTAVVFSQSILSFPSTRDNANWLRFIEGLIKSRLATYLLFIMSPRWGIDRDELHADDLYSLPLISDETIDSLMTSLGDRPLKDQDIFEAYGLSELEQSLVLDTVQYTVDFCRCGEKSAAMKTVGTDQLLIYYRTFSTLLSNVVSPGPYRVSGTIYVTDDCPLIAVTLHLGKNSGEQALSVCETSDEMREVMKRLDTLLLSQVSPAVYTKRHIHVYDGDSITIVKPNRLWYWTASQAITDADDMIAEVLAGRSV